MPTDGERLEPWTRTCCTSDIEAISTPKDETGAENGNVKCEMLLWTANNIIDVDLSHSVRVISEMNMHKEHKTMKRQKQ
jgi:hypothetical protein